LPQIANEQVRKIFADALETFPAFSKAEEGKKTFTTPRSVANLYAASQSTENQLAFLSDFCDAFCDDEFCRSIRLNIEILKSEVESNEDDRLTAEQFVGGAR